MKNLQRLYDFYERSILVDSNIIKSILNLLCQFFYFGPVLIILITNQSIILFNKI